MAYPKKNLTPEQTEKLLNRAEKTVYSKMKKEECWRCGRRSNIVYYGKCIYCGEEYDGYLFEDIPYEKHSGKTDEGNVN